MIIQVCVGSSCHLKGSAEVVEKLQKALEENKLTDDVTLVGSFCIGKCSRSGVTVQLDEEVHTGITVENCMEFFKNHILAKCQ